MSFSAFEPGSVSLGSLRRQCLFAVTILLVEDSRSASEAIRLRELVDQFRLEGAPSAAASRIRPARHMDTAHASPAHTLGRKVASAFSGNAAVNVQGDWEEF